MVRWLVSLFCAALCSTVLCVERETRIVEISQGPVRGYKDPEYGIFTFFGIPYATAPTGLDRYKAPLPEPSWVTPFDADNDRIICPQASIPLFEPFYKNVDMWQNCLIANVYVPDTTEKNLPVLVVIHGGGFQVGSGNLLQAKSLVKSQNIITVTFNYRLGVLGFLCLGTSNVPGNAGMKDQVALLRWVKKNIANFGGNPDDVTISGYSAGSASVELLMLSPLAKGLFNKAIAESGSALGSFAVQTDPLENAKVLAGRHNIEHLDDAYALEEFYKNASLETLISDSFFFVKDSTTYFSPCLESDVGQEIFLAESPYNILKSGNYEKLPLLAGFADSEGLMRADIFDQWKNDMNDNFSEYIPHNLQFKSKLEKESVVKEIKEFYFGNKKVGDDTILAYVNFFSDVVFHYPALKAVEYHVKAGNKVYLYEYNYVDELTPVIPHTEVKGANHCTQTLAVFDGLLFPNIAENDLPENYKKHKAIMRQLWGNFIKTGAPVPESSSLPSWPPTGENASPHMSLGQKIELRGSLITDRVRMWDKIYKQHYRKPEKANPLAYIRHSEL
ncbi:unnamed protein product [Diatraea saccharalis]|uniref:Carboxylic ester hydrolase n=1 Tax=Diatraea saccharalis TaxID=40085 RepID=A0A9N9N0S4_9NEOP|nr:unnamed protein product [Diatraea saccharalis]